MKETLSREELVELTNYIRITGAKKVFINVVGIPEVPLIVKREDGSIKKMVVTTREPIVTSDPAILAAGAQHPYTKIGEPNSLEMVRYLLRKDDYPNIEKNLDPTGRIAQIWKKRTDMEDSIRAHLVENGYNVVKSGVRKNITDFNIDSMITYLTERGYEIVKASKGQAGKYTCPRCRSIMQNPEQRVYHCSLCGRRYGLVNTGASLPKLKIYTGDIEELVKKQLAETMEKEKEKEKEDVTIEPEIPAEPNDDIPGDDAGVPGEDAESGKSDDLNFGSEDNETDLEDITTEDTDQTDDNTDDVFGEDDPPIEDPIPEIPAEPEKPQQDKPTSTKKKISKDPVKKTRGGKKRVATGKKKTGATLNEKDLDPGDISKRKTDFYETGDGDDPFI